MRDILVNLTQRARNKIFPCIAVLSLLIGLSPFSGVYAQNPAFVQTNYKEVGSGTTDSVAFKNANSAGNLIVVYVAWSSGTSNASLADTRGNTYASTSNAVRYNNSAWSSQIFYAKNVAAGSNTVTATFSSSVNGFGLVYVHEYSGMDKTNPLDTTAAASGTAQAMNSGAATTTSANDLIFGAGCSSSTVTQKGTGFTSRSTGAGNITEDKIGATPGSYNATATQNGNVWVMQMAAFKAAGTTPDTTPPSVPAGLNTAAISQTQVNLSWSASSDNIGVTGYKVYRNGTQIATTTTTTYQDNSLTPNTTYSYTVAAYDAAGNTSAQSTAVSATTLAPDTTPPSVPGNLTATAVSSSEIDLSWSASTDNVGVTGYRVYRDGNLAGTSMGVTYNDSGLAGGVTHNYMVSAIDAAGNESAPSASASATTQTQTSPSFPFVASVSANHRYLLDQFGHPYLMAGDSPHSLAVNLTEAQADTYFANRQMHGVNSVWVEALVNGYAGGRADGSTYDGIVPFTTPNDFSTPNPAYFQRVSDMVNIAAQHGVTVFLDAMETAGWSSQYQSNGATKDYNFGVYLGNLFKNAPNVVWITGNDYGGWWDPTQDNEVTSIAKGIASVDSKHLQTVQLNGTISSSLDDQNWAPIINMNGVYTYYPTYDETLHAYNQTPTMPVYMQEANYEFENNTGGPATTNETLRRQSWWTITSGGVAGQLYGNGYTWDAADWPTEQAHLDTPGVVQMKYWSDLLASREWYNLVPDQTHTFLTAGMGTYDTAQDDVLQSDYATAAVTPDGAFGLVYVPTARTITVDLSKLSGAVTARWFDPSNNTYQVVSGSPFAAGGGARQFTTPGANADGNNDWVLVLDGTTGPDTTAPNVPTNVNATGTSGTTASLTWSASTDNVGVAGYKIYRNGVQVGTATGTSYQDSGLTPNTTYSYTVTAYDFAGNESAQSAAANATTTNPDTTPPSAPAGLGATAVSSSEIDLSWSAATDNVGVANYKIYRDGTSVGTTASLSYKDMGLSAGTSHTYAVSAIDAAGNESPQSATASATTQAPDTTPPAAPTSLTVTATTSSTAGLSWAAATDNIAVTGYKVYRNGTLVSAVGTTSFTDTGLSPSTTYTYTVTAYDAAGNESAPSAAVTATTSAASTANPTFIQLNSATPQTPQTTVPVTFTQAQTVGNLNVVVVGFYSSTGTVSSVTDSAGNTYTLAAPLTRQNSTSQAIYYAKNVKAAAAGTNTVTVTFAGSVPYPDVRIAEYAGLDTANPFDATSSGFGFPSTATSGNVTTSKPVELLFGAGTTAGTFTAAGSGYTLRIITSPDADLVEDRVVTSSGTYAATAAQSSDEVMQVVAFKAAGQ